MWRLKPALFTTAKAGAVYLGAALLASLAAVLGGDDRLGRAAAAAPLFVVGAALLTLYGAARRQLHYSRRQLTWRDREHAQLLAALDDGVFMLDDGLRVAAPCSPTAAALLGRAAPLGENFLDWLGAAGLDEPDEAARYLRLLFGERVNERLVNALNPLSELRVAGADDARWLRFRFDRVRRGGRVERLRVIVRDVSVEVTQRQRLTELNTQVTLQKILAAQTAAASAPNETPPAASALSRPQRRLSDATTVPRLLLNYADESPHPNR